MVRVCGIRGNNFCSLAIIDQHNIGAQLFGVQWYCFWF